MRLLYRRTLFVLFTLAFFVIAPLLLFYASGYRYHFEKGRVEQVGQLYITTTPKGVDVLLDGKPYINEIDQLFNKKIEQTPTRLQNLLPGQYKLDLKKEGYWDWTRGVTIEPQITTFASDLVLLKKDEPQLIVGQDDVVDFSLNGDKALYTASAHEIIGYTFLTKQQRSIWKTDEAIKHFWFSASADSFLVETAKDWLVVGQDGAVVPLQSLKLAVKKAMWSPDGQLFVLNQDGILSRADWRVAKVLPIASTVSDFISKKDLFYLKNTTSSDRPEVWKYETGVLGGEVRIAVLPSNHTSFIESNDSFLGLSSDRGVVIVDTRSSDRALVRVEDARHIFWVTETEAIISGDFEISRYVFSNDHYDQELITRQGEVIDAVVSSRMLPYVLFLNKSQSLIALERGLAEVANTYTLAEGERLSLSQISSNGKSLFFTGTVSGRSGVFTLPLID